MPITECENCGGHHSWNWEEAFAKFGFGDGDGQVETWQVEAALREGGYETQSSGLGLHNTVIVSIRKDGTELIPHARFRFGYEDPREYLLPEIIALLDKRFPGDGDTGYLF